MHTDIQEQNWVNNLPGFIRPYIYITRIDRPIGIWLLALPGCWTIILASGGSISMNIREWLIFVLFGLGAIVMRSAGCIINDIWDRKLDQKVERTRVRPLASGTLNMKQALSILFFLLCAGLVILLQMNLVTILLGFLSLPLIIIYPLMKRFTWWPQAFLGLTFNFGALMGWSAITGAIELPALLLYGGGIFWTLGYDTIYAYQDKEDDALAGIKSTALKLGDKSKIFVGGFYALAWLFISTAALLASSQPFVIIFMLPAAAHFFWQLKNWDMHNPSSSLKTFKSSRDCGLIILAGLAAYSAIATI